MNFTKIFPVLLVVFLAGCTTPTDNTYQEQSSQYQSPYATPTSQTPPQTPPADQGTLQGDVVPPPQPTPQSPQSAPQLMVQEFTFETDDSGYYNGSQQVESISVMKNNTVKINFNLRTTGIYPSGGEYRGCGTQSPAALPGGNTSLQFNASASCTITAYWPSSGVAKSSLQVVVA